MSSPLGFPHRDGFRLDVNGAYSASKLCLRRRDCAAHLSRRSEPEAYYCVTGETGHRMVALGAHDASPGPTGTDLLRDRNFLIYVAGNTVSWLGTWAQRVGIGWLSWDLTHRAAWVGAIALAQVLPLVLLGPLFGTLLDRHDHRVYGLTVNAALGVLASLLFVLTAAHAIDITRLFSLAILIGIANSGYHAARLTVIADVVAPELLASAIAFNTMLYNITRVIGPAVAGLLIARYGLASSFALNAVSFTAILAALSAVRFREHRRAPQRGLLSEICEGLRYALANEGIRRLMALSASVSLLARGVIELLPAYVDSVFHKGSIGLANLTSAAGLGAVAGALVLSRVRKNFSDLRRLARCGAIATGVVVVGFSCCSSFAVGIALVGVLGFTIVLCGIGLQVLLQQTVKEIYRGRVMGLWTAVNVAAPGLGGALMGVLAQLATLQAVTCGAGVLCALFAWLELRRPLQRA